MAFTLPPLPYAYDALEPFIDKTTMEIHHDKHHAAYVNNLNKALESAPELASKTVEELLADNYAIVPEKIRTAVRNNGGGHVNHTLFWQIMNASGQSGSKRLDFDAWQEHWQSQSRDQVSGAGAVRWRRLPDANTPFHAHLPEDYALEPARTDNAAIAGAADGSSAGGSMAYLPGPPADADGAGAPPATGSTRETEP